MKTMLKIFGAAVCIFIISNSLPAFSQEMYRFELMWPSLDQLWYFDSPSGVAVNSSGHVYVADTGNNRIQKFDSNGAFITKWGSQGTGDGQFYQPEGVAADSTGNVYVADTRNHRIQKFDSNGNFITKWKWGSYGSGDSQFYYPNGVAVDPAGDVYVADNYNKSIQKFDSNGNLITRWGSYGSGDGQFYGPDGVAVDPAGNVYVADTGSDFIQKFDSNGNFITKWKSYRSGDSHRYSPSGVAVDSAGNVYVTDIYNICIQKFDSNGNFIIKWGSNGTGDGQFDHPRGVTVDPAGNVYVADTRNLRIQKFDKNGTFINKWCSLDQGNQGNCAFGNLFPCYPEGLAVDSWGNLYVASFRRFTQFEYGPYAYPSIQRFDSNGKFINQWFPPGGSSMFYSLGGITVDSSGNLYVANSGRNCVQKFNSNGSFAIEWGSWGTGDGQFDQPWGVAADLSGNVYVADTDNHRIQKFDSNGNLITKWGSQGTENGQFNGPQGVATDSTGNVYVADTGNSRVQKFDSDGNFITKWGSQGTDGGQFNNPQGVAVDLLGNVYVADTDNHRIQKFSPVIPHIVINPTLIGFSIIHVGSFSDKVVTAKNNGNGDLIIGTITSPSPPFSILSDSCSGQTLAPNGTCSITIRFSPTSTGNFSGNFNLPSNDPDKSVQSVLLTGEGIPAPPKICVSPAFLDFGKVNTGSYSDKTLTIRNSGVDNLLMGTITSPVSPFSKVSDNCSGANLTADQDCTVTYRFSPTSGGTSSSNSNIPSNDPDKSVQSVLLSGEGIPETISTPSTPNGPAYGTIGSNYSYSTGSASSNFDHPLEYRFDWGDGANSDWSASPSASKAWASTGNYFVRAQARCAIDTSVVSSWSPSIPVGIYFISTTFPLNDTHYNTCTLYSLPNFAWNVVTTFRTLELQFSSNQNFSSILIRVKLAGTTTEVVISSNLWKKVLSIPGAFGGTVYWRVVGIRADRTNAVSDIRSIIIEPVQPVTNPSISPTNKNSLPQLSWNNNCNTKFKVWFGSNDSFNRRMTFLFNLKNPNDNGGVFAKALTSGQWTAIKNLVRNASNQTIYWYVESWDALGRRSQSDVMRFVLIE